MLKKVKKSNDAVKKHYLTRCVLYRNIQASFYPSVFVSRKIPATRDSRIQDQSAFVPVEAFDASVAKQAKLASVSLQHPDSGHDCISRVHPARGIDLYIR